MAKPATQPNFESILDQPANEMERPPLLPRGYYLAIVQGAPRIGKSAQKQTEFVEFSLKVIAPLERDGIVQADEDELEEFGDVKDQVIPITFYLTEKSKYRCREFVEHCGVDTSTGTSLGQLIQEVQGCQVIAHVVHEPWQSASGSGVSARVRGTAPAED